MRQRYLRGELRESASYTYKEAPGVKAMFDKAGVVPSVITALQVQIMHQMKVAGFVGMATFLFHIVMKAEEMGYDFCRGSALKVSQGW